MATPELAPGKGGIAQGTSTGSLLGAYRVNRRNAIRGKLIGEHLDCLSLSGSARLVPVGTGVRLNTR